VSEILCAGHNIEKPVMPRPRRNTLVRKAPATPVPSEILDQFVRQGPISPEELGVRRFKKALIERALEGGLTDHLGYPPERRRRTGAITSMVRAARPS
jgi:hypothetical protein